MIRFTQDGTIKTLLLTTCICMLVPVSINTSFNQKNQNLSWIFNYCDGPDSMVVFYEDSLEYMILKKNEKLYLMIEKLKDEIDRYDSLLCDSTESIGRGLIFRGSAKSLLQK